VKRHLGYPIIKQIHASVELILNKSQQLAAQQMVETITKSQDEMHVLMNYELNRLQALQQINPAIRNEEVTFIQEQISQSDHYMSNATLKLQAIRVIVNK
jgi:ATP-dependent helicase HepA